MSAWNLGQSAARRQRGGDDPSPILTFVGKVLKWIPADVVALYAAAVTALIDDPKDDPNKYLVIAGVVLAAVVVVFGAFSLSGGPGWLTKRVKIRAVMAPIAFIIWSPTVPNSGWQDWHVVADHPGWTVVVCGFAGLLFSLIADGIDKRYPE